MSEPCGRLTDFGHLTDRGQEPLELYGGDTSRADGPRSPRHRPDAVRRRQPGKLHGSVPAEQDERLSPAVGRRAETVRRLHEFRVLRPRTQQTRLQEGVRARFHRENHSRSALGSRFRRDRHRASGVRVHVAAGRRAERSPDLRHPAAAHFVRRTPGAGALSQPLSGVARVGRPRRSEDVRRTTHQHRAVGPLDVFTVVQVVDRRCRGPAALRPGGIGQAVDSVHQRPLHRGRCQATAAERRTCRRNTSQPAEQVTRRERIILIELTH